MSTYGQFKNHLHNTLKITKAEIREMVEKAVYQVVERKMEVLLRDQDTAQWLVDDAIKRNLTWNNYWQESETKLDDYIKEQVVAHLLKGVKLKVEIAKTKKEATPPPTMITVRKMTRGK
jgi:hypothetical protein